MYVKHQRTEESKIRRRDKKKNPVNLLPSHAGGKRRGEKVVKVVIDCEPIQGIPSHWNHSFLCWCVVKTRKGRIASGGRKRKVVLLIDYITFGVMIFDKCYDFGCPTRTRRS